MTNSNEGHRQRLWKGRQRLDAGIPALLLHRRFERLGVESRIGLEPARGFDDLQRVGGCHQDLGEQSIRVESNGRDELLELLGAGRLRSVRGGAARGAGGRIRSDGRFAREGQSDQQRQGESREAEP